MSDRWQLIRECARQVLHRYECRAERFGRPPAFTAERGSYAVLKDMARVGLGEKYFVQSPQDLPHGLFGRLDLKAKSITVCSQLESFQQALVTAHLMGHVALKHPLQVLCGENTAAPPEPGSEPAAPAPEQRTNVIEDGPAHINEQPQYGILSGQNGAPRAAQERERLELEANVFALELLAPLATVRAKTRTEPDWNLAELALYFGLSHEAMRHQLVAALFSCPSPDPLERPQPTAALNHVETPQSPDDAVQRPHGGAQLPPFLKLDPQQREAAEVAAPALVVAGPGAGKTRVLTARFVHLVQAGVDPQRILALTFSNKAAAEMQERLSAALPDRAHLIQVFTFHSLGLQLLSTYGDCLGYEQAPRVLSDSDAFVLLRSSLHRLPLGQFHNLADPTQYLEPLLTRIGRLKDDLIDPAAFRQSVVAWQDRLAQQAEAAAANPVAAADPVAEVHHAEAARTAAKCLDLAAIYETYQAWLQHEGYVDYGDLIHQTLRLFEPPEVAATIHQSYEHILVDEFQDINFACGQLIKALDGGRQVVWAVADPRQSIYGFRGAALSNLTRFEHDYPGAHFVTLNVNYRSVAPIVAAGQALKFPDAPNGQAFVVPHLRSGRAAGREPLSHHQANDSAAKSGSNEENDSRPAGEVAIYAGEAMAHNQEIAEVVAQVGEVLTAVPPTGIAILCHNKYLARDISTALEQAGIATNWSGQLEEREAFKDLMAVLLLACNQPQALLRLARMPAHNLSEDDLRLLLGAVAHYENNLRLALKAAHLHKIEGLSPAGQAVASELARVAFKLHKLPNAWQVLVAYLLEETTWIRAYLHDAQPYARRYLAAAQQLLELAHEFMLKGKPSPPSGTDEVAAPTLSGTAAFVDYIKSARETGKLPTPDSTPVIGDAVNVLTIHKSKGLEWPVVFVPDWTFAIQPPGEAVPLPAHLLRDTGVDGAAYSQACLYYVAVTRACDRLFLSRSQRYNRDPLPFWDDLVTGLAERGMLHQENITRPGWTRTAVELRVPRVAVAEPIPYAMIRQYQYCAQRAKYDYVYGLNAGSGGYLFFVRRLRQVLRWIAASARKGEVPTEERIEAYLQLLWERDNQTQRHLLSYYVGSVRQCALTFARRVQPGANIHLDEEWHHEQPGRPVISFRLDEVEYGDRPVVRFHRYGQPSPRHETDPALFFYAGLALSADAPEVRLHYLESGIEKTLELCADHPNREKQQKEIYTAAFSIKNGLFEPKPNHRNACDRCPYTFICPA